mgnify:CR=1 FL=1
MLYELVLIAATGTITPFATYPSQATCEAEQSKITMPATVTTACRPTMDKAQQRAEIDHGLNTIFYVLAVGKKFIDSQKNATVEQSLDR